MQTGAFTVGRFAIGRLTGKRVVPLAMPYLGLDGQRAGVVVVALGLDWLALRHDSPDWDDDHAYSIVDADRNILVRQPDHIRFVGQPFPPDLWAKVEAAITPGSYDIVSPLDGIRRIVGFVPPAVGPGHLYVGVGVSHAAAFAALNRQPGGVLP